MIRNPPATPAFTLDLPGPGVLATVALATVVLGPAALAAPQRAGEVRTERETFTTGSGEVVEYETGTLFVPENRGDPGTRVIGIGFARFPTTAPRADGSAQSPPVFQLPGGPGSSYLARLDAMGDAERERALAGLARLREFSDVVMVDQRGFSPRRGEMLTAMVEMPRRDPERPRTMADELAVFEAAAREVVAEFEGSGTDLRGYTGYEEIILNGTSFGSQWSFAVMKLHPEIVARALLSGVEPLDSGYDMPSYVFAAVQRMWLTVDGDPRFSAYLPEGGMAEAALEVIERLEREPVRIEVTGRVSGRTRSVGVLGPLDFPWNEPVQILELFHGRTGRWNRLLTSERVARRAPMPLIAPLIDSSLGVTPQRRHRLWTDPATRYLGRGNFAPYLATAEIWPSEDVGDAFRTPEPSDIPVVFAQGDWDTQTPLENTFEIAPFFVNSRVVIAERGGHGVLGPISAQLPEVWAELLEFLRDGDMDGIPARVRLQPSRVFEPPDFPPPGR